MWDERFQREDYVYGKEPNTFLATAASQIPPGRVLCLGDGEGRNGVYLASLGYEVTAVDQSAVGLAKVRRLAQEKGVSLQTEEANLADFDLGEEVWDGIVSIFCHLPGALRREVYAQVISALKPQGVFLLAGFAPAQLNYRSGGPKDLDLLPSLATLQAELEPLRWVIAEEVEQELQEGAFHQGPAALIHLLGVKA